MSKMRAPAVAGQFYPGDPGKLRRVVNEYISHGTQPKGAAPKGAAAKGAALKGAAAKAIIAPHAGYIYSGPIAGSSYAYLAKLKSQPRRVVLIGPSHWARVAGLAASSAQAFVTPLGNVPIDAAAMETVLVLPQVIIQDEAHVREHCLEVHLPFLQTIFDDFVLVPLVVGDASASEVAEVLKLLWVDQETIVVISSDLSHYHDYETAVMLDKITSQAIEELRPLKEGQACGRKAINGLLYFAKQVDLHPETVDLRNSGDTAGPKDRVVGYGAYVFHE